MHPDLRNAIVSILSLKPENLNAPAATATEPEHEPEGRFALAETLEEYS